MAVSKTLYVRNRRPNTVVVKYGDPGHEVRIPLAHRGGLGRDLRSSPGDACALPGDAERDPNVSRWLKNGTLEKITEDDYMTLQSRKVDTLPNEFLKSQRSPGGATGRGVKLYAAQDTNKTESNTAGDATHIRDGEVSKIVRDQLSAEWAGELMSTAEELEAFPVDESDDRNYPSKYRDNDEEVRRQMGY